MKGRSDAGIHSSESGQIDEVLIIKVSSAEMKLADELHVALDTSGNEVRAIFERPAEELHHFCSQLCQEFMTHIDEGPETDSWCLMDAVFTCGHFTPGVCVNLVDKSCVLAKKAVDFFERQRNGGDSTIDTEASVIARGPQRRRLQVPR